MASYDDSQDLRGVKRSLDEDDMDFPDLDLLDPRNHSPVVAAGREVNANSGSSDPSIAPKPAKFLKTNDGKAEPTTSHGSSSHASGLEHFTESLHKPSTSETGSLDTTSQPYTSVPGTSGTAGNNDDVLQLPTTTASVLTQLDKSMSSGADSESDTDEKKLVDIETCSNASSPTKSPKKQSDQKDKDKKVSEDKNEEEDAAALLRNKREKQEEERLKMQVLVSNFSEDQLNRYEMFRRAAFPKAAIKRLMQNITGTTVSHNVVIAMSGISKVFVGEAVETALDVTEKLGETGPLQPKHLREAGSILKRRNSIPNTKYTKRLFRR